MFKSAFYSLMGALKGLPKGSASNLVAISNYTESILGPPTRDLHEKYSPDIHVDLLWFAPNDERDFHYVVTSGMSDHARTNGGSPIEDPFVELVMALPENWDVSPQGFQNPRFWQPFKLLKMLARYPKANATFFARTHTVPLGDQPLLDPMKAVLFMPPVLVREFAEPLNLADGRRICFLAPYLLHQDELDLKLGGRLDQFIERFGEITMTEMYDIQRPSVLA